MALQFFMCTSQAARRAFLREVLNRRLDVRTISFNYKLPKILLSEKPPKGFEKFFRDKPTTKKDVPKETPESNKEPPKDKEPLKNKKD